MVGYYNETNLPVQTSDDAVSRLTVKRVVCSPDLPIATSGFENVPSAMAVNLPPVSSMLDQETGARCSPCNKTFPSRTSFQIHQKTVHVKNDPADDPYRYN